MARLLWVPSAQPGSYFPAVPIAQRLQASGHELTVLCETSAESTFRSLGCAFRPTSRLDAFLDWFEMRAGDRNAKLQWHAGCVTALFEDVGNELAGGSYDAVMADPLEPGALFAAEAASVPAFSYVHHAMDENGADVPFRFHFWDQLEDPADAFIRWWNSQRALVGLPPDPRPAGEHRWYRCSRELTLILRLPELVHPKGALPRYAQRVGPMLWEPPHHGPLPDWVSTLGRQRPAILVSVSTAGQTDAELLLAVTDALADQDLDIVATVANVHNLPPLPANVRLTGFLAHGMLLEHTSIVVSHAGNGTVTRAACAGIPQLLIPWGRDQHQVASGATSAGAAIALERHELGPDAIRAAISALSEDPTYARRSHDLAIAARRYTPAQTAAATIEALLRERTHSTAGPTVV